MPKNLNFLRKIQISPKVYLKFPETPGIYVYWKDETPIYIGKAINLKNRISSYFAANLETKTARMISEANYISFIKVNSELEALLLEAKLIRKYLPQYNIAAKDDKHPLYIAITKEKYPRIITARKIQEKTHPLIAFYGPFPSSNNVRSVLRWIRRIFPFSDHKLGKRACLYSHIGLCKPCPNDVEQIVIKTQKLKLKKLYLKNIRNIKRILDGHIEKVSEYLKNEMKLASYGENYEIAAALRDQIQRLEYVTQPQIPTDYFLENPNLYEDLRNKEITELKQILRQFGVFTNELKRIECFDIAHLAGTSAAASMVTFINGEAEKKFYRHFRIRQQKKNSDVDSLTEVIKRRLNHLRDWGRPDLIIVDGGKPQVGVFVRASKKEQIPIVGLAKRFETLVIPVIRDSTMFLKEYKLPRGHALNLVARLRDEAHRFARTYHHKLIIKNMYN